MRYIKSNDEWHKIKNYYLKQNDGWISITEEQFAEIYKPMVYSYSGEVEPVGTLEIRGLDNVEAINCSFTAVHNSNEDVTSACTWSIIEGSEDATINNHGVLEIIPGVYQKSITIQAVYAGISTTKTILATYNPNITIVTVTTSHTDESGNTTTTTTTTITDTNGSSEVISSSVLTDESGNTITSNESTNKVNIDGSTNSTSTNYDSEGNPTDTFNTSGDTDGTINSQGIIYDESGNSVVSSYSIDTSNSEESGKTYNHEGVNTDYYAFDLTDGFELDFNFTINFSDQPAGQDENHHNILTAKRATPSPWYGFQLRHSSTNRAIQLGTQFSTGGNTNTPICAATITNNTAEYNIKIIYDPTATANTFVCYDLIKGETVFTSNSVFPDIEELKYLKLTIGYAMDANGDPYRYSNINVKNFSIKKLSYISEPVVGFDGETITLTCETVGADIYYRLNQVGVYRLYAAPITITEDTTIETYSKLNNRTSSTVIKRCTYSNGIEPPTIECDGLQVTIDCETPSVDIYYRLNETGEYSAYTEPITITANTVVEAYAELDGRTSETVKQTCIFDDSIKAPIFISNGTIVTLVNQTSGASVYYRLNQLGEYALYNAPISITANTFIEAYAELSGVRSVTASETCVYDPNHDYRKDYLTFRIISGGTINWTAFGTGYERTIEYSINNGTWRTLTASTTPTDVNVSTYDIVRFRGINNTYAGSKANYDSFEGSTAIFDIEGNIMSLIYGDEFSGSTALTSTYNFCSIFKKTNVVSAENLILPSTTLTNYCYRAMFSLCTTLTKAPALPAMTLATGCYWYMFEQCAITEAPELNAPTLVRECYGNMFTGCTHLNYIKCLATNVASAPASALTSWVKSVAASGTFVKDKNTTWSTGANGIPNGWTVIDDGTVIAPDVYCTGDEIIITCQTAGATIYYKLDGAVDYSEYTTEIPITADTIVETYAELNGDESTVVTENCIYNYETPYEASNKTISAWTYNNQQITTPYSVNAIDGHSSSYAKGTFTFETNVGLRKVQPTYLWFQHADQSASVYVDGTLAEKHWGGYNAFFVDISNYIHKGVNNISVDLKNNEGNKLAPVEGDFNFNATLGNVKLFTSPVLPAMDYGYDGFHITSDVADSSATINVKTAIPTGATVVCTIDDGTYHYSESGNSTGDEMVFTATVANPHLWNGTLDPHLYTVTLEIYHNNELYHRYERGYGLRYYDYVINDTSILPSNDPYTGFLLNGAPYLLRGVCMHDDLDGKANALNDADYTQEFNIIQELGCNFIRLAHYPHPKEVYDWCDRLGIVVQTEVPCVNKMLSTLPDDYYTNLEGQYADMVNQHYNHPCIMFWGLSNETTTDDSSFAHDKMNGYIAQIKALDSERLVGYVMSHSYDDPLGYYNNPDVDWVGCNIYVGWYIDQNSNNPSSRLNTRITKTITNKQKAMAFSEYGCGGTQNCHSDDFKSTTTRGNHERHDIEYQMWLHEGHIAAIRNYPQLLFTAEWQLFDIAVAKRNEGCTVCLDGENASTDDNLRRLNNKGLVERDHRTKKDTFYLYKAEWNPTPFVHICGKDYTKSVDRVIKCYTNDGDSLSLYVDGTLVDTTTVTDHIAVFSARTFNPGATVIVSGANSSDSFKIAGHDYSQDYLTFNVINSGTIFWKTSHTASTKTISYSKNNGETWTSITSSTAGTVFNVSAGDKVIFKGDNLSYGTMEIIHGDQELVYSYFGITGGAKVSLEGNIMSLINSTGFTTATELPNYAFTFYGLFSGCTSLISVENLILPATTLTNYCYQRMFIGCTSLTTAPELPASALTQYCYYGMFDGCTSLKYIKCLATDISAIGCTNYWVRNVSSTGTFVKNANMSNWTTGVNGIPSGWTIEDAS